MHEIHFSKFTKSREGKKLFLHIILKINALMKLLPIFCRQKCVVVAETAKEKEEEAAVAALRCDAMRYL